MGAVQSCMGVLPACMKRLCCCLYARQGCVVSVHGRSAVCMHGNVVLSLGMGAVLSSCMAQVAVSMHSKVVLSLCMGAVLSLRMTRLCCLCAWAQCCLHARQGCVVSVHGGGDVGMHGKVVLSLCIARLCCCLYAQQGCVVSVHGRSVVCMLHAWQCCVVSVHGRRAVCMHAECDVVCSRCTCQPPLNSLQLLFHSSCLNPSPVSTLAMRLSASYPPAASNLSIAACRPSSAPLLPAQALLVRVPADKPPNQGKNGEVPRAPLGFRFLGLLCGQVYVIHHTCDGSRQRSCAETLLLGSTGRVRVPIQEPCVTRNYASQLHAVLVYLITDQALTGTLPIFA